MSTPPTHHNSRPWTGKEVALVVARRKANVPYKTIAQELGRSVSMVWYHAKSKGIPKPRIKPNYKFQQQLKGLVNRGLGKRQMAGELGCTLPSLNYWLRKYSYVVPRTKRIYTEEMKDKIAIARGNACRAKCAALGWPMVFHPVEAAILNQLLAAPGLTRKEIGARLTGTEQQATDRWLVQCLGLLKGMGYVTVSGSRSRGPSGGTPAHEYSLTPFALAQHTKDLS